MAALCHTHTYGRTKHQGRRMFQKVGCASLPLSLQTLQLQRPKASKGDREGVSCFPADWEVCGSVVSSASGTWGRDPAANDFVAIFWVRVGGEA